MSGPRETKESFGQVAIEKGFLTPEHLGEALRIQKKLKSLGLQESLGEILVKKEYMTADQVKEILKTQGRRSGTQIPGYKILEKLGAGGMGAVYKAQQLSMDRPVAIKVLDKELARKSDARDRFLREGRMAARLNHPNIVAAYDVGQAGNFYYLVMEFVDGQTLQDRMKSGPLAEPEALELWLQVAQALVHAAKNGLVHRDVKPGNILIDAGGRAKLADLGLARPVVPDDDPEITVPGTTIGTPWYISPEQAKGWSDLDIRTDIYSLGATFHHVLTGKPPFDGPSGAAILARHLTDPPESPDRIRPGISNATCRIVLRSLAKDRLDRFASAEALVAALEDAIAARTVAPAPARRAPPADRDARHVPSPPTPPPGRASTPRLGRTRRSRKSVRYARRRGAPGVWFVVALLAGLASAATVLFLVS